jgi:hypothetical protein
VTIAPNGKTASYKDPSGDTIQVTTTKGNFTSDQFMFDPNTAGQLMELSLTGNKSFNGAAIAFTISPVLGGSDVVNIGYIDALNLSLGSVTVPGDLGRIDVGGGATAVALGKLTVQSLGVEGAATQGNNNGSFTVSTLSNITGTVGTIDVAGNIDGSIFVQDFKSKPGTGNIRQLNIGGSLDGNTSTGTGEVLFTGTLTTAVIGGGIEGGAGDFYGSIAGLFGSLSKIGSITVKGSVPDDPNPNPIPSLPGTSILGGSGRLTGGISATTVGSVYVAGDVFGGTGTASGEIQGGNYLGKVTVGGSLIGGNFAAGNPSEADSAGVVFGGKVGSVTIDGNIYGGSGLNSGEVLSTGLIQKVTVMGDVAGGSAGQASSSGLSGVIHGASLGSVVIEGSLIGGNQVSGDTNQTGSTDGAILSDTTIGSIYIGKNLTGGSGPSSGMISTAGGGLGTLKIGGADASDGNVVGGSGASSGSISVDGTLGKLVLTHDLTGGSGTGSGLIEVNGAVTSMLIGGNVTGGTADNTGTISAFGLLKNISIQGNLTGSSSGATKLTNTGYLQADGIGTMNLGGALTAGTAGAGGLDTSGAIRSTVAIGSITVGSLVGNSTNPAIISAVGLGRLAGNATSDVAINKVTVTGSATYGDILAGYSTDTDNGTKPLGTGVNADAQIGTVTITKDLTATNIVAGVGPGTTGFGTSGSTALSGAGVSDLPTIISRISKIIIEGTVTAESGDTDTYGIAAQNIASAMVNGTRLPLLAGPDNDTFASGKEQSLGGGVVLYEV